MSSLSESASVVHFLLEDELVGGSSKGLSSKREQKDGDGLVLTLLRDEEAKVMFLRGVE